MFFKNTEKVLNSMKYLMIFLLFGLMLKNLYRINNGIKNNINTWQIFIAAKIISKKKVINQFIKMAVLYFINQKEKSVIIALVHVHIFLMVKILK